MLSESLKLAILTQSIDATAIYDSPDLHISFVNDAMLQMWGKGREIVGKTLSEALPELKEQTFIGLLQKAWQTGEVYKAIDTPATISINGELKTFFFDFELKPVKNAEGKVIAVLHSSHDVSSRIIAWKQVNEKQQRENQLIAELTETGSHMQTANHNLSAANEELQTSNENINRLNVRLQESETDFKRLVEQAPVAILVFRGPDMMIDLVNKAMLDILDKDNSIIGKPLLEGLPEIKGAPAVNMLFEVYNTGKMLDGNAEPVPLKRNGIVETRYFNFSYRPLLDEGRIIGVMDVAVDVTEQVLASKRLEANEQRLQRILDTMAEGVVIVDAHARPTYANAMAQRIIGRNLEQLQDRNYDDGQWQNVRPDGTPIAKEDHPIFVVLRTGMAVYDQEVGMIQQSGETIYIAINAVPLIDDAQTVTGGILTFTDVTNRRIILQQKDDFISVASHELKTPVTALKASLQLLDKIKDRPTGPMHYKLIEQANRSLNKLSDLISALLNVNRISQGRFPIHKTTFKITDLINDCCQHIRTAGSHEVILRGKLELQIEADEQLLDQVIVNLVNNAVKYAPRSKEILIEVEQVNEMARISVTDKGPGIPEEKARRIFERYYQAEENGASTSGLGLGLYISAEIIEKHGGQIGVNSKLGEGSTFWFTLPHYT